MLDLKDKLLDFYPDEDLKLLSGKRIAVLTDKPRWEVLGHIAHITGGIYDPTTCDAQSSVGWVQVGSLRVYCKPKSKQGNNSAGLQNEVIFDELFQKYNPGKMIISDGKNTIECDDILGIQHSGADTKGRKKADIVINSKNGPIPLSLKKDNAEIWESADKLCGPLMKLAVETAVRAGLVELNPYKGVGRLTKGISISCTEEMQHNVMFGSDIFGHGAVLVKTFTENDFTYCEYTDTLTISVTNVIQSLDDVKGTKHEPCILFRNDATRRNTMVPGVRALVVIKKRINKSVCILEI